MKKDWLDPQKRKMLLALPLLLIPFLTMAFWALGGGKNVRIVDVHKTGGLNVQLPNAQLKDDRAENKLSYYETADKDSIKTGAGDSNGILFSPGGNLLPESKKPPFDSYPQGVVDYRDPNEQKVYQKLAELNSHLNNKRLPETGSKESNPNVSANPSLIPGEVDRLEELVKRTNTAAAKDPEVEQLNAMMDRIIDIQHPERVQQQVKSHATVDTTFYIASNKRVCSVSLLDTGKVGAESNQFFGVDPTNVDHSQNAIAAVIHEAQTVADGSVVKLRLLEDISVDNNVIERGSFVYGKASFQGERMNIEISSLIKNNSIYPVKLNVYDLDGMQGISVACSLTTGIAKQAADRSLQSIEMTSLDPSLKAQAAGASIAAAKTLLTKKVKLQRVSVKAGYKVLLK